MLRKGGRLDPSIQRLNDEESVSRGRKRRRGAHGAMPAMAPRRPATGYHMTVRMQCDRSEVTGMKRVFLSASSIPTAAEINAFPWNDSV